jgi:hypothetical protein
VQVVNIQFEQVGIIQDEQVVNIQVEQTGIIRDDKSSTYMLNGSIKQNSVINIFCYFQQGVRLLLIIIIMRRQNLFWFIQSFTRRVLMSQT